MSFRVLTAIGLLTLLIPACKRETAEELVKIADREYSAAVKTADSVRVAGGDVKKLFQPAIDALEKAADEYPGTEQAEYALARLAAIRNNDTREPELAIAAYRRYLAAFPDGQQAPTAMFLIGYLYNNDLHNTDSAAAVYRRYLEKYPQHEMATSAQYELENLGKKPEELLPEDQEPLAPPAAAARPAVKKQDKKTL